MPLLDAQPDALAQVYARSLYELAHASGGREQVESVLGELEDLLELARRDAGFSEFLASRVLAAGPRAASLDRIFKGRLSDLTLRFVQTLNDKNRLRHLIPIVRALDGIVQDKLGRVEVDLYTATPVSGLELTDIRDRLRAALKREPIVHPYVDARMIGGVKIQIGDQLIDGSVATQIRRLAEQLRERGSASVRMNSERLIDDAGGIDIGAIPAFHTPSAVLPGAGPVGAASAPGPSRRPQTTVTPMEVAMTSGENKTRKKNVHHVAVGGKRVLIRVDFNVPFEDGQISDDRRIREAIPTIRSVIDRGGRAILCSHMGRPEGTGYESAYSLAPVAERLSRLLGRPVQFPSQDCTDAKAAAAVAALADGQVLLLENLRFHKGEKKGDAGFAGKLAAYADVYVNDAFGTCHRPDASMVAVPTALAGKPRVIGFLVEKEIKYLSEALAAPAKPFVVVLGGAKVSDKMAAIEHLLPKADAVLVGGAMAYTFLAALGRKVGTSKIEADRLADAKRALELAARLKADLHLPQDHVCSNIYAESGGAIEVQAEQIRDGFMGLDIGPATQADFAGVLARAKTVVWNGPMGVFEWRPYSVGTQTIARAMAEATSRGAVTIVGGGDTASAADQFGLADRMSHVSTGGGASLEMLEGKVFQSVELLENA